MTENEGKNTQMAADICAKYVFNTGTLNVNGSN